MFCSSVRQLDPKITGSFSITVISIDSLKLGGEVFKLIFQPLQVAEGQLTNQVIYFVAHEKGNYTVCLFIGYGVLYWFVFHRSRCLLLNLYFTVRYCLTEKSAVIVLFSEIFYRIFIRPIHTAGRYLIFTDLYKKISVFSVIFSCRFHIDSVTLFITSHRLIDFVIANTLSQSMYCWSRITILYALRYYFISL